MTTPVTLHQPFRRALCALLLLAVIVSLVVSAPASAAASCGSQVINDWYDDGRIDGTYAAHCYDDAIEKLPRDVLEYSSAEEDITRALQAKLRGDPAPPARTDPSPDDEPPTTTTTTPPVTETSPGSDPPGTDPTRDAGPPVGDSASSVPIPLLVLAGLALLLIAGGSASYIVRRVQSRRLPPPAV